MFSLLARSVTLKRFASRYGMTPNGFARRFIAGETITEAIEAARATQGRGMHVALDYLGESVNTTKAAIAASRCCLSSASLASASSADWLSRDDTWALSTCGMVVRLLTTANIRNTLNRNSAIGDTNRARCPSI